MQLLVGWLWETQMEPRALPKPVIPASASSSAAIRGHSGFPLAAQARRPPSEALLPNRRPASPRACGWRRARAAAEAAPLAAQAVYRPLAYEWRRRAVAAAARRPPHHRHRAQQRRRSRASPSSQAAALLQPAAATQHFQRRASCHSSQRLATPHESPAQRTGSTVRQAASTTCVASEMEEPVS